MTSKHSWTPIFMMGHEGFDLWWFFAIFVNVLKSFGKHVFPTNICYFCKIKNGRENTKIDLFVKEDCFFFCLSFWYLPNHNAPCCVLNKYRCTKVVSKHLDLWCKKLLNIEQFFHWKINKNHFREIGVHSR